MIYQGAVGQAAPIAIASQYLDDDAQPATPTSPEVKIIGGNPAAVLATLVPVETLGLTGFMLAELDVSNVNAWPAGQYVVRWTGVTSGKATSSVDTLQLVPSAQFATTGTLGGSYTTEDRIRAVDRALSDTVTLDSMAVAMEASRAADYINGRLAVIYTVPFVAPFSPTLVLLNDWKAAALLLDRYYGENGNRGLHAVDLHAWVDKWLDAIIAGELTIPGVPILTEASGAIARSRQSKHQSYIMPTAIKSLSSRSRT